MDLVDFLHSTCGDVQRTRACMLEVSRFAPRDCNLVADPSFPLVRVIVGFSGGGRLSIFEPGTNLASIIPAKPAKSMIPSQRNLARCNLERRMQSQTLHAFLAITHHSKVYTCRAFWAIGRFVFNFMCAQSDY